jgi:hypothetical protein
MTLDRESYKIKVSESKPPVFNVDCYGIDFDTYQFLLGDITQGIEDGNRMYGFGEPGYIGADANYYPFSDSDPEIIATIKSRPEPKRKRRHRKRAGPSIEEVAIARGIIRIVSVSEAGH